jgi:hypothetical protein
VQASDPPPQLLAETLIQRVLTGENVGTAELISFLELADGTLVSDRKKKTPVADETIDFF